MKRPLHRGKRLKPESKKRRAARIVAESVRQAFKFEFPVCMACRKRATTDCHEIVGAGMRQRTMAQRELWIACCRPCHAVLQGLPQSVKHATELAIKAERDPDWFSMTVFRAAKGGGEVVDEFDIELAACRLAELFR